MGRLLALAAAAATVAALGSGTAHAAPDCTQPVQVNCQYCTDPGGNPAPPEPCTFGHPHFYWADCAVWVAPSCIVGN